jgi:hypothetical protein
VRFFHFLNSNSKFEFGPVGNRGPVPTVSTGSVNPGGHCLVEVDTSLFVRGTS